MKNPYARFFLLIATLFIFAYSLYECSCIKKAALARKAEKQKQDIGLGYTPAIPKPMEDK